MLTAGEITRLEAFLARALSDGGALQVKNVARLPGGASRQTYSFDAVFSQNGSQQSRGFILRRDPPDAIVDTDRALEFAACKSMQDRGVPAPRPLALVSDARVLGAPAIITERIENAHAASAFHPDPFGPHKDSIGRDYFAILGRIAAIDPYVTPLAEVCVAPAPHECWSRELDHWARIIAQDALEPQPIAQAAIRRLRANPPPSPPRLSIVHGDYRIGNFLHDRAGVIRAIIDWELTHIGDPMEDLAWALDPLWAQGRHHLAAGLIPMEDAIEIWEDEADQDFDAERYQWWSIFSCVKGIAIWVSSARALFEHRRSDPVLAFSSWYCLTRHNQILADRLSRARRGALA
ncbi:MAG: phosphotransferase family protein [Caulobacterales bacterium]